MKIKQLIFFTTVCIFLISCQSPSEKIKNAFRTVDSSLTTSNKESQLSIDSLYAVVNKNRQKDNGLASKADMVYIIYQETYIFLDSLKQVLHGKDASGTNTFLATKLLVNTVTTDSLTSKLSRFYTCSNEILDDQKKHFSLDISMGSIQDIQTGKDWSKKYFENTPTIAAITMLSKLQNECLDGATIVMRDLKYRLSE